MPYEPYPTIISVVKCYRYYTYCINFVVPFNEDKFFADHILIRKYGGKFKTIFLPFVLILTLLFAIYKLNNK